MKNLETRLKSLQDLCNKLEIQIVDFHRVYVITIYPESITIQSHLSSAFLELVKNNFAISNLMIGKTGFIEIELEFQEEKFKITLT
jgi:hypothetical protein